MGADDQPALSAKHNVEIRAEDINGIIYHIDKFNNVYSTEDILKGVENPKIVATHKNGAINYPWSYAQLILQLLLHDSQL